MTFATASRAILHALLAAALYGAAGTTVAAKPAPPVPASGAAPTRAQPSAPAGANLILNGDFENTTLTAGCHFNLDNSAVTASVANVTAFGAANEIDVSNNGTPCLYGLPPQSGVSKLAIHRQTEEPGQPSDEFSFELSEALVEGNLYLIEFYAQSVTFFGGVAGEVQIGVSTSAASFGSQVFAGTPSDTEWTLISGQFSAPVNATYLTVRVGQTETWNHIDNFSLVKDEVVSSTPSSWGLVKSRYRDAPTRQRQVP